MICAHPITIQGTELPCKQCMPCRINAKRLWMGRILLEHLHSPNGSAFLTLTYDEEHLPEGGNLVKDHLKGWKDRMRMTTGLGPFRYFAVGEYGGKFGRPHYHVAVFNLNPWKWLPRFQECWPYGFTHAGFIEKKSANYITGYTLKKLTRWGDERLDGKAPEFALFSKRPPLGAQGMREMEELCYTYAGSRMLAAKKDVPSHFRLQGASYPVGDYWRNWLRERLNVPEPAKPLEWEIDYESQKKARIQAQKAHAKQWAKTSRDILSGNSKTKPFLEVVGKKSGREALPRENAPLRTADTTASVVHRRGVSGQNAQTPRGKAKKNKDLQNRAPGANEKVNLRTESTTSSGAARKGKS